MKDVPVLIVNENPPLELSGCEREGEMQRTSLNFPVFGNSTKHFNVGN